MSTDINFKLPPDADNQHMQISLYFNNSTGKYSLCMSKCRLHLQAKKSVHLTSIKYMYQIKHAKGTLGQSVLKDHYYWK